jgi:hypothetical protein
MNAIPWNKMPELNIGDRVTYWHPANTSSQYHMRQGTIVEVISDGVHAKVVFDGDPDDQPLCFGRFVFQHTTPDDDERTHEENWLRWTR